MWNWFGKTDVGQKRENNQDCFEGKILSAGALLCVVCDGMGGAAGGSLASTVARDAFFEHISTNIENTEKNDICTLLDDALAFANTAVYEKAESDKELEGMGTTLCAVLACDGMLYCLSVGDSRIYVVKENSMSRLSHDHSFVQTLVDSGQISEEEARVHPNRNIILKAVGTEKSVKGDVFALDEEKVDKILICSDGLCGYVDDEETSKVLFESDSCESAAGVLVDKANEAGGFDNITVVVMEKEHINEVNS